MAEVVASVLTGAVVIVALLFLRSWAGRAEVEQTEADRAAGEGRKGKRAVRMGLYGTFGGFAFFILLLGLGLSLLSYNRGDGADVQALAFIAIGLLTSLILYPKTRRLFAAIIPFNPRSYIETLGLVLIVAALAVQIAQLFVDEDIEAAVTYGSLAVQTLLLVAIAFVAVGARMDRTWREAAQRLGLVRPTLGQVGLAVGFAFAVIVAAIAGNLVIEAVQPSIYDDLRETLEEVTANVDGIWGALAIGLAAALGEELLFRGAIQPRYGLVFTAVVFAFLHVQYHPALILTGVLPAGIILGLERKYLNTTACIITHALYNIVAVLLA